MLRIHGVGIVLLAVASSAFSQPVSATNSPNGAPLSTRVVGYTIDAKLDPSHHTLDATETLTYKNLTGQPLTRFPFHLYLNAFRPESSFTSETHFGGGIRDSESDDSYPDEKLGKIEIQHIAADGFGDLTPTLHFTAPDDGNMQDHTVAEITLPHPLAPGDSVTFHLGFHDQFPLSVARNGYKRDFVMGGQWYPKVGVFWHGAWNCHQYHSTTEFFSDFGTFNVHLTVPNNYTVGASGIPTGEVASADGKGKTLGFYGEDIHDFAWAASPHFYVTDGTYQSSLGPVKIHVLALQSHPQAGQRYLSIIEKTMQQFDHRYGPYPYKIITVIDPEPGSQMEGMEYPTLITGGTSWWDPIYMTEITAEHEFGHQYWYGMVATNEFEDAWLDEGINSYTEVAVVGSLLGAHTSVIDAPWINASDDELERLEYALAPDYDPVTRAAWKFHNSASYGGVTYGKTATLLDTLESVIGKDTMDDAMRTYFMRYRFSHPTAEDFLRTIEEVAIKHGRATAAGELILPAANQTALAPSSSGTSSSSTAANQSGTTTVSGSTLRPFFNQAVYGTNILDYAVDSITSDEAEWWKADDSKNKKSKDKAKTQYRDTVVLHRKGDFILPVTVEVVFEDGSHLREHWDGADRWTRFTYMRPSKILSAEIDPDHVVPLDTNLFNNSITTKANDVPAHKLSALWTAFLQFAGQVVSWLV